MKDMNILIVGVGGQGTLLASKFLGVAAVKCGKDVKLSEVHGMSQRGGSVITCVKIGSKISSPIIDEGQADFILSFEELEAIRWLSYLKVGGSVITNTQKINPMPVISGVAKYPEEIIEKLNTAKISNISLDAFDIATKCGSSKAVNVVLLGVLAAHIKDVSKEIWQECINAVIPEKLLQINRKAFEAGYELGTKI